MPFLSAFRHAHMLQALPRSSWPFARISPACPCPFVFGNLGLDPELKLWTHQCWIKQEDHTHDLQMIQCCSWCSLRKTDGLPCCKGMILANVQPLVHHRYFSAKLPFSWLTFSTCWGMRENNASTALHEHVITNDPDWFFLIHGSDETRWEAHCIHLWKDVLNRFHKSDICSRKKTAN